MDAHSLQQTHYESYRTIARRVHALMSTPRARVEHQIVLPREPADMQPAWDQVLEEIRESEGVTITPRSDGSMHIAWFIPHN